MTKFFRLDDLGLFLLQRYAAAFEDEAAHWGDHVPSAREENYDWILRAEHVGEVVTQRIQAMHAFQNHVRWAYSHPTYIAERGLFIIPHCSTVIITFAMSRFADFAALVLAAYRRHGTISLIQCETCQSWVEAIDPEFGLCSTCLYAPVLGRPDEGD